MARLSGKRIVVTGAGRGLGRSCVERLAADGAAVIAIARTRADLDRLESAFPGQVTGWEGDVASDDIPARIEALEDLWGLVNNAGTNRPQPFAEVEDEALDAMLSLNLRAAFRVARAAVRAIRKTGKGGSIVQMSSQMGHVGSPGRSVYCLTKHGIEGLTKAMAVELAPDNIRVNAVAPTFIETPMTAPMLADPDFGAFVMQRIPLGRLGQPQDVAAATAFLLSEDAGMITGDSLKVDGGWTAQ